MQITRRTPGTHEFNSSGFAEPHYGQVSLAPSAVKSSNRAFAAGSDGAVQPAEGLEGAAAMPASAVVETVADQVRLLAALLSAPKVAAIASGSP